jgi:Domain of unknown function (DUF5668)
MNRYILIRRLRGPAFLLLLGILALLHQTGVVNHFWHLFWPLALILWGVLLLAERAALEVDGYPQTYPDANYPGAPYPQGPPPGPGTGYGAGYGTATGTYPANPGTSIVPANSDDLERSNGGQS